MGLWIGCFMRLHRWDRVLIRCSSTVPSHWGLWRCRVPSGLRLLSNSQRARCGLVADRSGGWCNVGNTLYQIKQYIVPDQASCRPLLSTLTVWQQQHCEAASTSSAPAGPGPCGSSHAGAVAWLRMGCAARLALASLLLITSVLCAVWLGAGRCGSCWCNREACNVMKCKHRT